MMARLLLGLALMLVSATSGLAHRLDEYLQAATVDLVRDRVVLELRLMPGTSVAPSVLAGIDGDGDGTLSAAEQVAYAEQVRHDLSLTLDGQTAPLRLVAWSFPAPDELLAGTGDITLRFEAAVTGSGPGPGHELSFTNRHLPDIAAFLVNTLQPRDPAIRVLDQDRSYDQSTYRLRFASDAVPGGSVASSRPGWADGWAVVRTYAAHGVRHILTGYDHLLFVAALVLGAATLWDLVKVVTAFTVAHSLTLTLAALGLVHLPDVVVEPLISASIVFVAVQNMLWPGRSRGATRLAVAFLFGLFHGLGFASGLLEIMHGMATGTLLLAIAGFSLGIEAGNQIVLLPLYGMLTLVRAFRSGPVVPAGPPMTIQWFGSAVVSIAGTYYLCLALFEAV